MDEAAVCGGGPRHRHRGCGSSAVYLRDADVYKRQEKPGDVLSEGQMVDAKITAVDEEKQKISLSIRALLADEPAEDEE